MKAFEQATLLRIFIGESDKHHGKPLYEQIVFKAHELHLAGATVIKGIMGFGADSRMHTTKLLGLSADLPIIIEIVDSEENIDKILPWLDETVKEGMVTTEKVNAIKYTNSKK